MSLFDPNNSKFLIKWEGAISSGSDLRNCEIQNGSGEKVAEIKTKGLFKKQNQLFDNDGSLVFTTIKSTWSENYKIIDSENNIIGNTKSRKLFLPQEGLKMENNEGVEILTFKDPSKRLEGILEMNAIDGKKIAKFSINTKTVKISRWSGEFHNTCTLQILDTNFDRKTLFGMLISCISSYFDHTPDGGGA